MLRSGFGNLFLDLVLHLSDLLDGLGQFLDGLAGLGELLAQLLVRLLLGLFADRFLLGLRYFEVCFGEFQRGLQLTESLWFLRPALR